MLVIFDEFQRVADMTRGGQPCSKAHSFQDQVESMAFAPWIVSGSSYHLINYVVGQDPYFGRFNTIDLEPLQGDVLLELVDRLSRYYRIDVVGAARDMLLGEGYGNPFYVHSLVQSARNLGQSRIATREDVRAAMEAEMTGGLIFRDWERHFNGYFDPRRLVPFTKRVEKKKQNVVREGVIPENELALLILYEALLRTEQGQPLRIPEVDELFGIDREESMRLCGRLYDADLFDSRNGGFMVDQDVYLWEFIRTLYRLEFGAERPTQIQIDLGKRLREVDKDYKSAAGYIVEKCVADLINQWHDDDEVPAILFDWEWFRRATAEEREQELAQPTRTVRLVRPVVPAARNSFIQVEEGKPAKEVDIWASGLWEDYETEIDSFGDEVPVKRWTSVTWVIDVRYRAERTDAPHVKGFAPKVEALHEYEVRRAEGKPAERPPVVPGWLISKSGFTAAALALARQRGYYTSDLEQLNRLFRRFGLAEIRADLT
jgi:hypothetical protein